MKFICKYNRYYGKEEVKKKFNFFGILPIKTNKKRKKKQKNIIIDLLKFNKIEKQVLIPYFVQITKSLHKWIYISWFVLQPLSNVKKKKKKKKKKMKRNNSHFFRKKTDLENICVA